MRLAYSFKITEVETSTAKASKTAGGQASFTGLQIGQSHTFLRSEARARPTVCSDDDGDKAGRSSDAESRFESVSSVQLPYRACVHECPSTEHEAEARSHAIYDVIASKRDVINLDTDRERSTMQLF